MNVILFLSLIIVLAIGLGLFIVLKSPQLVPQSIIVKEILATRDSLFSYRMDVRRFINDATNLFANISSVAIDARVQNDQRKRHMIERQLVNINEKSPMAIAYCFMSQGPKTT